MPLIDEKAICKMCRSSEVELDEDRFEDGLDHNGFYDNLCYDCATRLDFTLKCLIPTLKFLLKPVRKNNSSE
jgi:uncharacterized protein YlaI